MSTEAMEDEEEGKLESEIVVTAEEWRRLMELIENPPPLPERMRKLLEEYGVVAQSGERLFCTQEVVGAEPIDSTEEKG